MQQCSENLPALSPGSLPFIALSTCNQTYVKTHPMPVQRRMVDGARGILNALLADVFIFTDHMSGIESGLSPGFGITLVAETTSGQLLSAEASVAMTNHVRRRLYSCIATCMASTHCIVKREGKV